MQPSISVILPVKNGARYIEEALDSIARQTEQPLEVLVIEAASTDGTAAILERCPWIRRLLQTEGGLADAWNLGLRESRGDAVAFLDSDDRWSPDKLRLQSSRLADRPDCLAVIGHVQFFIGTGESCPTEFRKDLLDRTHAGYMPGTLLARKALFDRMGLFDPSHGVATDIEWFARLRSAGIACDVLPDLLLSKRVHGSNYSYLSAQDTTYDKALLRVLRAGLKRSGPAK